MGICKDWQLHILRPAFEVFDVVQDWECVVLLSDENHINLTMKEKFNSLFASLKLNSSCALSKKRIADCLQHSVPLNCLNLRPTSSKGQSTQYLPTQSGDLDRFSCTDELSSDLPNFFGFRLSVSSSL